MCVHACVHVKMGNSVLGNDALGNGREENSFSAPPFPIHENVMIE